MGGGKQARMHWQDQYAPLGKVLAGRERKQPSIDAERS